MFGGQCPEFALLGGEARRALVSLCDQTANFGGGVISRRCCGGTSFHVTSGGQKSWIGGMLSEHRCPVSLPDLFNFINCVEPGRGGAHR